ncbi:pyridine nucleotide-disulfide oxidoreductase [Vibrio alginolyticus]|uniref:pyridine nucleotide-disulfide oxidoreductase n=1 Tax=Vibrio alginolyticus TaxID=663 RepID=UPI0024C5ACA5|nr:pyridine nucleotide-disulfide oxidoreductase [Vibrio alginolyticus]
MSKIVIIGGVAGGASAAARARRLSEDAEIIMFERGPFVSLVNYMISDIKNNLALLLI